MKTIQGDLIQLGIAGKFDVIIHGCNCFCTMGSGIAKSIKKQFPKAFEADYTTEKGDRSKLGTITFAKEQTKHGSLTIVNGYTKFNLKADYEAIRGVFRQVKSHFSGLRIGYPAIGAGLAGGDWKIISEITAEELDGEEHTFVAFQTA